MVAPNTVEIPGLSEELRREARIRAEAFQPAHCITIAGIRVRHLSLGLLVELEAARVAFVNPWSFDTGLELAAECARFIWHVSEQKRSAWLPFYANWARSRMVAKVAIHPDALGDLRTYLDEAFYDAPVSPPDDKTPKRFFTHWTVGALALINKAGFRFTEAQLMEMRLSRLWQYYRLAAADVGGAPLINPSDVFAQKRIEEMNRNGRT